MEVDDITPKPPLVVIDGANVAYAYAEARDPSLFNSTSNSSKLYGGGGQERTGRGMGARGGRRPDPDPTGVLVACKYFLAAGCRVKAVVPAPWVRSKPRPGDACGDDALMVTPAVEVLRTDRKSVV